jgi:hypothetical protein
MRCVFVSFSHSLRILCTFPLFLPCSKLQSLPPHPVMIVFLGCYSLYYWFILLTPVSITVNYGDSHIKLFTSHSYRRLLCTACGGDRRQRASTSKMLTKCTSDERRIFQVVRNPVNAKRCKALLLSILNTLHLQ